MSECRSQGLGFDDGDYLELMFVMSEEQGAHRQAAGPDPPGDRGVQQHDLAPGGEAGQQRPR